VMAGAVHGAADVRKAHSHKLDAFSSGDVGPLGRIDEERRLHRQRAWPSGEGLGVAVLDGDPSMWPVVEIVTSHAGATGAVVDALVRNGVKGLVIAATGNGTVHEAIEHALERTAWSGVAVMRATRCGDGAILETEEGSAAWPSAGPLTPAKARVELMLRLMPG
jgi:L-asparaginase